MFAAPFGVRLFEEEGDYPENVDTMVEPDLSVVCNPGKLDDHGCKGAPDMVIEVLNLTCTRGLGLRSFGLLIRIPEMYRHLYWKVVATL